MIYLKGLYKVDVETETEGDQVGIMTIIFAIICCRIDYWGSERPTAPQVLPPPPLRYSPLLKFSVYM